ncbi:hypothetical protein BC943DRAFT_315379 [Umbelopsis sp. AD052]|nr:hypothetical protein BC943DRAFT_315379 [Umbelopsis sp. AD052]
MDSAFQKVASNTGQHAHCDGNSLSSTKNDEYRLFLSIFAASTFCFFLKKKSRCSWKTWKVLQFLPRWLSGRQRRRGVSRKIL